MRIASISLAGFRGVREPLELAIPAGFAVVTGRNGSGKSTICDAVEFALTGTLSKYVSGSEAGESVGEYIWWRGDKAADAYYVRVEFVSATGERLTVERTRDGASHTPLELGALLCDAADMPPDPMAQLCRTSIIRDETLAAESVDLSELERFRHVRAAIGSNALEMVERRNRPLLDELRRRIAAAEQEYQLARVRVTTNLARISELRAAAGAATVAGEAEAQLRRALGDENSDLSTLRRRAASELAQLQVRTADLLRLRRQDIDLSARETALNAAEGSLEIEELRARLASAEAELAEDEGLLAKAEKEVAGAADAFQRSLAALYEHGNHVGLVDGKCPLCKSALDAAAYSNALAQLRSDLSLAAKRQAERDRQLGELRARQRERRARRDTIVADLAAKNAAHEETLRQRALWREEVVRLGLAPAALSALGSEGELARINEQQRSWEQMLAAVDASSASEDILVAERVVSEAQNVSIAAEKRLAELQSLERQVHANIKSITRAINELVEERLAALEPLLKELYVRLRPHVDWRDLQYHLRGNVRRLLSLRVGDGMNPRFVFSSGQRRAAGLAFLLAVFLSRPWARLQTLILDDPIQHVDDFRALHFVEVLSAVRKRGPQILCSVEDPALAGLLCRRLGIDDEDGAMITLSYEPGRGVVKHDMRFTSEPAPMVLLA